MTNLTGTKWLINENPSCNGSVTKYSINFHWSNDETRTFTNFTVGGNSIIQFLAPTLLIVYQQGTWYNTTTRTIEILGGTDTTNSNLINWMQANATPVIVTYNVTYSIQNATCTPETIQSGGTLTFQITPNNGYLYPSNVVVNGTYNKVTYNSLTGVGIVTGVLSDINISGKAIAEFVTVDFTTLSGWSNIAAGQHSLTIVAMGNNYADSIPSAAITINKIIKYNVTIEATHITYTPNPLPSVGAGESLEITLTADEGYAVPETVTITGEATTEYTKISDSIGKITISNIAGDIGIIVAGDIEKLTTPTEFTVTKGLASWNSVDKATAYEFVAVDSNNVESSIGSYTPPATAMLNNIRIWGECDAGTSHYTVNGGQQQTLTEPAFRYTKRDGAATKAWADVNAIVLNDVSNLKVSVTGYDVSYVTIYDSTFTSVYHQYITQTGVDIDVTSLLQNGYYVGVYSDD